MTTKGGPRCRWAPLLMSVLAAALLAACASAEKTKPAPVPSVVQGTGQALTVSSDNSGAGIVLEPAQELVVRLPVAANAGYEWSLVDLKPGVLALRSTKFERALRSTNAEEASGTMVWRFAPEATGSVALRFDLRRPRSLLPAVQTVSYAVTVK